MRRISHIISKGKDKLAPPMKGAFLLVLTIPLLQAGMGTLKERERVGEKLQKEITSGAEEKDIAKVMIIIPHQGIESAR
jgi:hypothetical protein